jgi:hypothetical protein
MRQGEGHQIEMLVWVRGIPPLRQKQKRRKDGARRSCEREWQTDGRSAALLASGHDGGVESFTQIGGQVVDFVGAVDFDGLAGGIEDDLAVSATAQMGLQLGAHIGGHLVVDQIVEKGKKVFAGHFTIPVSMSPFFLWK